MLCRGMWILELEDGGNIVLSSLTARSALWSDRFESILLSLHWFWVWAWIKLGMIPVAV